MCYTHTLYTSIYKCPCSALCCKSHKKAICELISRQLHLHFVVHKRLPTQPVYVTPSQHLPDMTFHTSLILHAILAAVLVVLSSACCYTDACNHKRICADPGHILIDSCPRAYNVDAHCKLTYFRKKCCYTDACNHKHICAYIGEKLIDSCPKTYDVAGDCKLTLSH